MEKVSMDIPRYIPRFTKVGLSDIKGLCSSTSAK
jgi:hypothetical protein